MVGRATKCRNKWNPGTPPDCRCNVRFRRILAVWVGPAEGPQSGPEAVIWGEARCTAITVFSSTLETLSADELPVDEVRERACFGAGLPSGREEHPKINCRQ